jgi:hypothetical protein
MDEDEVLHEYLFLLLSRWTRKNTLRMYALHSKSTSQKVAPLTALVFYEKTIPHSLIFHTFSTKINAKNNPFGVKGLKIISFSIKTKQNKLLYISRPYLMEQNRNKVC